MVTMVRKSIKTDTSCGVTNNRSRGTLFYDFTSYETNELMYYIESIIVVYRQMQLVNLNFLDRTFGPQTLNLIF